MIFVNFAFVPESEVCETVYHSFCQGATIWLTA